MIDIGFLVHRYHVSACLRISLFGELVGGIKNIIAILASFKVPAYLSLRRMGQPKPVIVT